MILPILTFPNDILRTSAKPVSFPLSKEIIKLTQDMMETVQKADGIGLAAPQVGKSVRVIVINLSKEGLEPFALYNAQVISRGGKKVEVEEGCLSIPKVFGMVKRPLKLKIRAQNAVGETIEFEDGGWVSRVAQHEIDHTDGILIIDHIKKYTAGEEIVKGWEKSGLL